MANPSPPPTPPSGIRPGPAGAIRLLGPVAAISWALWPTLREMSERWAADAKYSHAYLVPLFSLFLLWGRREHLRAGASRPAVGGLALVALGAAMQLVGAYFYVRWLCGAALVPYLAGLSVLLAGWRSLRWTGSPIGFLVFMVPLPWRIEVALGPALQSLAAIASAYALQTLGFPALVEGNVVTLNDVTLGIVEACSGLSMLITFFAITTAVALMSRGRPVERAIIIASAVPIALVANVIRITATGVLHETAGRRLADLVFHDLAGYLMMPIALGLLWAEWRLLAPLIADPAPAPIASLATVEARQPDSLHYTSFTMN